MRSENWVGEKGSAVFIGGERRRLLGLLSADYIVLRVSESEENLKVTIGSFVEVCKSCS